VVGIGASAGGLEACKKLVGGLPARTGMAFILVQHLDPTHESMMVDLLSGHTALTVVQAIDGAPIERDHLYVIPPGAYLSIAEGGLRLSRPQAHHGARLPFDFLLHSMAQACGPRAIGVVLSGTGADGSAGLVEIKQALGRVIAQDPEEAAYDGMPRSAIATGAVDLVLPVGRIAEALVRLGREAGLEPPAAASAPQERAPDWLPEIIDLLRLTTGHDFRLYKHGTLQRRIERRMAMAGVAADDMGRYLDTLRADPVEQDLLAKDLLINVTSFFRDPKVFEALAETVIPELIRERGPDLPLRIWVAGCSTGEETYSIAMLLLEAIAAAKRIVKLQVFASDVDPDAVAEAREGRYPDSIAADVSPERLERFFSKEDHHYRVSPELRSSVVFTVQDVLTDPPFARLDMVSCRNLLIYLGPEAQARVVSLFHFALREGGVLLLGNSETVGGTDSRFEVISKSERLYRNTGRGGPRDLGFSLGLGEAARLPAPLGLGPAPAGGAGLAELCRRMVMDAYAPAAVLIDRSQNCLYSLGPTDRYLRMAPGHSSQDLLSMARPGLRAKLKAAIQQARDTKAEVAAAGCAVTYEDRSLALRICVRPVPGDRDDLLLVCFIDEPASLGGGEPAVAAGDAPRIAELERELDVAKSELMGAIRDLEVMGEEHKAINEEASSVNEEFQSTNEELLTSKEELQSLNEELTALNGQLQETLERQRTTSDDLQNILYSTDIATLFLDARLNIRFFTPAVRRLFNVIPGDVGRPLSDLNSLARDATLAADARTVLQTLEPLEREIETGNGVWFVRRILPYRAHDSRVEGVVITFTDITDRKHISKALEAARLQAELANVAKSRFLAAASHDLRQPLQTIALLQGLLAKAVEGERAKLLVARLDEALGAMSGMLNTLLDINQIEAGVVRPELSDFPIAELFDRIRDEFTYHAQAQRLAFRVVGCSAVVRSDPRLLEQMLRNLLSNALKYTKRGKVLLGCRRRPGGLSIEVWDTGVGIAEAEFQAIFDEYHQLENPARERSRGLGLGLSIVKRLGDLLDHPVRVGSRAGKGSMFAVDVTCPGRVPAPTHDQARLASGARTIDAGRRTGAILIVEDDPEVRELLEFMLRDEGHAVTTARDGLAALDLVARGMARPDLILADYNLPGGMDGLQLTARLREEFHHQIPVVVLTGDISTDTLRHIAGQDCVQLNKPVKSGELIQAIGRLLPVSAARPAAETTHPAEPAGAAGPTVIHVVDDDDNVRAAIRAVLEDDGRTVEDHATAEAFLAAYRPDREALLLIDAYLPGMSGLDLLRRLDREGHRLPSIMITGDSDVPMAVQAMQAGASDFIEKPVGAAELIASIDRALERAGDSGKRVAWRENAANHLAGLTPRQREVMDLVLAGHPSKNIAADLGISQRTVENHRASIMKKTGCKSLPALARLALTAA
jgi:two-component system CheB/CheR fusion protein